MDCVFCRIAAGDIPSRKVYENDEVLCFHDIAPSAPVHVLIIPKKHVASIQELEDPKASHALVRAAQTVARELGVAESGYRLLTNVGPDSGQEVFHLHLHLLAGTKLGPLVSKNAE